MPARARKKRTPPAGAEYGTPAEVAEHLIRSEGTLANWRSQGKGPPWKNLGGSIRYDWAAVYEWEKTQPSGGAGARRGAA